MSFETVEEKIEFLNSLTGESLGIVFYTEWELNSYALHSLFSYEGGVFGPVHASSFVECVNKAFKLTRGGIDNA